jgi:hypothetical protein
LLGLCSGRSDVWAANAGLARAKAEGKTLGRPKKDDVKQRAAVVRLRKQGS